MYSKYYFTMDTESANRYRQKICVIGIDPYTLNIKQCSDNKEHYPKITYPDIVNYLLYQKSAYTHEDFKAYKSLEAYKQAVCGWVKKVMHSQRLSEQTLSPWIITKSDGTVLNAHCDCMAGLGEACTHIAAVLFFIDWVHRSSPDISPTDVKAYWVAPSKISDPKQVSDIDFAVPSTSKSLDDAPLFVRDKKSANAPPLSHGELHSILSVLKETQKGCVLHAIVPPFSEEISEEIKEKRQYILTELYKEKYAQESLETLRNIGAQLNLKISIEACKEIEVETDKQASSRAWFNYRAGRITASRFKAVCRTNIKTKATIYGCEHEKEALNNYSDMMKESHNNFGADPVGLCISPQYPHFGASPDGLISCDCCGLGCVEIKCPYCAKDLDVEDTEVLKKVGLENLDEEIHLSHNHTYYYQIQMQLGITKLAYCDFVVWNKNKFIKQRIFLNEFFWEAESKKATTFFYNVILPELLGKYFTRSSEASEWHPVQETGTE
ncbi:hypothetical protein NQ317_003964 [Molorchus minor]|uniref:SWIM-type domain-containing protein n=1 Tax=Molorchus minor TaxID=1323400 RepID=A0ABQ9JGW7_9CUCU|nr:hypothetical protein NQ317_003964 [Molorchus minor]